MEYRLHRGDCIEFLKTLDAGSVDAIVTDPPYGIGYRSGHNSNRKGQWGKWARDENFAPIAGDDRPFDPAPWLAFGRVALFGANHFADKLPASRCWITWDKLDGLEPCDFADCEYVWTNADKPSRIFRWMWRGLIRKGAENVARQAKAHPHQKPLALMTWLLRYLDIPPGATIFDPYMGSGTTGVAALQLGCNFIGCELDPVHFATAETRIAAAADSTPLFDPPATRATSPEPFPLFAGTRP